MNRIWTCVLTIVCFALTGCARSLQVAVTSQRSGTDASLRGLHAASDTVAWASGTEGTVLRTVNGGRRWDRVAVPGAETLDFRDVHAFDESTAVIATAGQPARLYRTEDGGASWAITYETSAPEAFFNAIAFWDDQRGLAVSDAVGGRLLIVRTDDGGRSWTRIDASGIPAALEGEIGFAASGTCLCVDPQQRGWAWIALGGATGRDGARVMWSRDWGGTWSATATPLATGESAGVFSLVFHDARRGVIVGGDYRVEDGSDRVAAWTDDGGMTWNAAEVMPRGYRSVVATGGRWWLLSAGPLGTDWSGDGGRTWSLLGDEGFHTITIAPSGAVGWAAGSEGRIVRLEPLD